MLGGASFSGPDRLLAYGPHAGRLFIIFPSKARESHGSYDNIT